MIPSILYFANLLFNCIFLKNRIPFIIIFFSHEIIFRVENSYGILYGFLTINTLYNNIFSIIDYNKYKILYKMCVYFLVNFYTKKVFLNLISLCGSKPTPPDQINLDFYSSIGSLFYILFINDYKY